MIQVEVTLLWYKQNFVFVMHGSSEKPAHSLLNIIINNYRVYVCGVIVTELHLFFYCNVHCSARTVLYIIVHEILTKYVLAECF